MSDKLSEVDTTDSTKVQYAVRKSAADNCMQVKLSIRKKTFRVKDEESARKIEQDQNLTEGTINATKGMNKEELAKHGLATLTTIKSQAEKIYYQYTLDSGEKGGARLLNFAKVIKPAAITFTKVAGEHGEDRYVANIPPIVFKKAGESYDDFQNRIGETPITLYAMLNNAMKDACYLYQDAFKDFLDNHYDNLVAEAKKKGIYNDKDYPPKKELVQEFGFTWSKAPLRKDQAEEFESLHGMDDCVQFFKETNEKMKAVIKKQSEQVLSSLMEPLGNYLKSMKAKEDKENYPLYDSLRDNLLRGVSTVRASCDDPELEKLCSNIEATIGAREIEDLKSNSEDRGDAIAEAAALEEQLNDYCKEVADTGVQF